MKRFPTARRAAYVAAMATLLICCKEVIAYLPNVELVSLLVALFAVHFGTDALYAIYTFALVQGLLYGFNLWWWVPYLYVWTVLWFAARAMRRTEQPLAWGAMLGIYALVFGFLCALPYFVTGGIGGGLTYYLAGLGFDLIHTVSNFFVGLLLWRPLSKALALIAKTEDR